jgi:predicted Fe-Mo cluster-binding NifX family protein
MKIAISTDQGQVSAHFGRCPSYTILEIKEGRIQKQEEVPNPGHQPGFLPQYLSEMGIDCIVAGGMGPRAQALFSQKNIVTIIGVQGSIDDVIKKIINQELESGEDLCDHHGLSHQGAHPAHGSHLCHGENANQRGISPTELKGKICFTSSGKDLSAELDPKFGRTLYFLIFDTETSEIEVVENPNRDATQGAGIQTAQLILNKDVSMIVTGQVGPNARSILESANVNLIEGAAGKIEDILEQLKSEKG